MSIPAESAPAENLSPLIVFKRDQARMEADLAVVAAESIGFADVGITIKTDRDRIYPSLESPTISIVMSRDMPANETRAVFTYMTGYDHSRPKQMVRVGRARLQQATLSERGLTKIDDRVAIDYDKSLMRHRNIRTTSGSCEGNEYILKRASSRTVVAMARLAAYHAKANHTDLSESSQI